MKAGRRSRSHVAVAAAMLSCALPLSHAQVTARRGDQSQEARLIAFRHLVERQGRAWEQNDFGPGASDWLPDGVLISPGGRIPASALAQTITDYNKKFMHLRVTVTHIFLSADGNEAAIEWDWNVTRRRDGKQGTTHDAILVTLKGGRISSWREYFDLGDSVDAQP